MKVNLITHTPDAEKIVAAAAKLCYSQVGVDDILDNLTPEKVDKFLDMLMGLGHQSPIEHVSYTFAIEGVSRVLTHQLVRHRIASYSQQSQRYVKLEKFEFIVPPSIEKNQDAKEIFTKAMENDLESYRNIATILEDQYVEEYISEGMSEKSARRMAEKKAIEDARFVFPNACETKIVVTMNARTLIHFFAHRCCNRAQWEIRDLAKSMLKEVKAVSPTLFKLSGPPCVKGGCVEGNMTCGKIDEVRAEYRSL